MLPSVLYDLPDYSVLYPELQPRPLAAELLQPVTVRVDPATQTWDQALTAVAKAGGINVLSDSYPRPDVFRPASAAPLIEGGSLGVVLDAVARHYGYVWWKSGDWYLFRHRYWADEQQAGVPDRITKAMSGSIAANRHLSARDIATLAALSDEQ